MEFCHWAMGAMGLAIAAMAAYIVKQHLAERAILKSWLESLQSQVKLLSGEDE